MASTINATSTSNGGLISTGDDSGVLNIQTNETTAVTIDASQDVTVANDLFVTGNVGIGTSSPTTKLVVNNNTDNSTVAIFHAGGGTPNRGLKVSTFVSTNDNAGVLLDAQTTAGGAALAFGTAGTERARIDSSGNLLVGTTTGNGRIGVAVADGTTNALYLERTGGSPATLAVNFANAYTNFNSSVRYQVVAGGSGGVYLGTGATSWASASDERLKTELTPFENAAAKVSTLRAGTGRYLTDGQEVNRSFLIAQDVQAVLPEAVDVQDDEQGTLGLRYTDLIPLLTAAIQEQQALITTLTERITALEAK